MNNSIRFNWVLKKLKADQVAAKTISTPDGVCPNLSAYTALVTQNHSTVPFVMIV